MKKIFGIVVCCLLFAQAACASSPNFDNGVALYNSARYQEALAVFQQELQSNPTDAMSHYYTAVSWHCLGRLVNAAREYVWILNNSSDPDLQRRAQFGMHALSRVGIKVAGGALTAALPAINQQMLPVAVQDVNPQPGGMNGAVPYPNGGALAVNNGNDGTPSSAPIQLGNQPSAQTPKIVDLYTDWCGWCHRFEPLFEQAQVKYGNQISFVKENGEARESRSIVKKYKVHGYPTLLFFDENGKLVKRVNGAPMSLEEFEDDIFSAFPALREQH